MISSLARDFNPANERVKMYKKAHSSSVITE